MLTQMQVDFYNENGYLIVPEAFSPSEIAALCDETVQICRGQRGKIAGLPGVSANDSDEDVITRTLCIHFPHKISELMLNCMRHPVIVDVLTRIIGPDVKSMQSMLFIKAAGKPGQAWHQDEDFIPTRDRSLTGAWIALDDATVENGCLWMMPGSHKAGILWEMEKHNNPDFDCTDVSVGFPYTDADAVPAEVKAGSVVFFNGYTLHRSLPNVASRGFRRALVYHYMSASSLLPWRPPREGEFVSTLDHRDVVIVAGRDPYHWKGYEDIMKPSVRPSLEGGCKWAEPESDTASGD